MNAIHMSLTMLKTAKMTEDAAMETISQNPEVMEFMGTTPDSALEVTACLVAMLADCLDLLWNTDPDIVATVLNKYTKAAAELGDRTIEEAMG